MGACGSTEISPEEKARKRREEILAQAMGRQRFGYFKLLLNFVLFPFPS